VKPWAWWALALVLAGCERDIAAANIRVVRVDGSASEVMVTPSDSGQKRGRGYVALSQLGEGDFVRVVGKEGEHHGNASAFPGTYRFFLTRQGQLQLVRYRGPGEAPPPGAKSGGHEGKRHRDQWETLDESVHEVRFSRSG
jgi:hypothetical protein